MKTRLTVLALMAALLVSVAAVAFAVTTPALSDIDVPECPEVPTMTTKNDGHTMNVVFSDSMQWVCCIWNWNWEQMTFTNPEQTEAVISMDGHSVQPGYGIWQNSSYDDDGNCVWSGMGNYEMPYAFDGGLANGVNVKYKRNGALAQVTIQLAGTEYFDNGASTNTTITYKNQPDSIGNMKIYISDIKEEYADGSFIKTDYAMDGLPTYAYMITDSGEHIVLFNWEPAEETEETEDPEDPEDPEEETEEDLVIFEGSMELTGIEVWDNWADNYTSLDLTTAQQIKDFVAGESIKVTFEFPYEDWYSESWSNGPMLLIQPTDNWAWGQFSTEASDKEQGVAIFTYEDIAASVGDITADREYKYFAIYPSSQDLIITKVEIIK